MPLQRVIDPAWVSIALVLLGEGISEPDILRATRMGYQMEWAGIPQKFENEIDDWGRVAELTSSGPLLRIAAKGIDLARREMNDWMEREAREQLL